MHYSETTMISERGFHVLVGWLLRHKEVVLLSWVVVTLPSALFGPGVLHRQSVLQRLPHSKSGEAMQKISAEFPKYSDRFNEVITIWCDDCTTIIGKASRDICKDLDGTLRKLSMDHSGTVKGWDSYFDNEDHPRRFLSADRKMMLFHWNGDVRAKDSTEVYDVINHEVAELSRKYEGDGVHIVSVGIMAQYTATNRMLQQIMKIDNLLLLPMIGVVLWLMIGNVARVLIPFICALVSLVTTWMVLYVAAESMNLHVVALVPFFLICSSFALAVDYGLFLLTRFREELALGHSLEVCLSRMLYYSGHVTCLSGSVLILTVSGYFFFPDSNELQIFSYALGVCTNIVMSLLTSLTITPCLLAMFPKFFGVEVLNEPAADELAQGTSHTQKAWKSWGRLVTRHPYMYAIPVVTYLVMLPVALHVRHFRENLNLQNNFATDTPEYLAYKQMSNKFPVGEMEPIYIVLQAQESKQHGMYFSGASLAENEDGSPRQVRMEIDSNGGAGFSSPGLHRKGARRQTAMLATEELVQRSEGPMRSQPFFEQGCKLVHELLASTKGRPFELDGSQVSSVFWNPSTGECITWNQARELLRPAHQHTAMDTVAESVGLEPDQEMRERYQAAWRQGVSHSDMSSMIEIRPTFAPFGEEAIELVNILREIMLPRYEGQSIGEYTLSPQMLSSLAIVIDMKQIFYGSFIPIMAVTIAVAFFGIGVVFRSALVPARLLFTVALPVVFVYGLAVFIYQDGWLNWLGFAPLMSHGSLDWKNPIYNVLIIVGLALDYDIFLFARVHEYRQAGYTNKAAIVKALSQTGPIISAAGTIMAIAFSSFAIGPVAYFNEHGFIIISGILLDTFIIRSCLVPSIMCLCGDLNYWPLKMPEASKFEDDEKAPAVPAPSAAAQEEARFWLLRGQRSESASSSAGEEK